MPRDEVEENQQYEAAGDEPRYEDDVAPGCT
jgi:hypothetical protein